MEQLAGGVSADQLSPIMLDEDAVAVSPVGAEGIALQLPPPLAVDAKPCAEAAAVPYPSDASTM